MGIRALYRATGVRSPCAALIQPAGIRHMQKCGQAAWSVRGSVAAHSVGFISGLIAQTVIMPADTLKTLTMGKQTNTGAPRLFSW